MAINLRERLFRAWYWYVSKVDKNAEVVFMNYGYSDSNLFVSMDDKNEPNRFSIQLYHHLAIETDLRDKDIVEIGSGRGGGLSYLTETFFPKTALGVDMNELAISFCKHHYRIDGLSFIQGDAQKLSLDSNYCDVVINVESSHRYPDIAAFFREVYRILRPDGYFLYTDFRLNSEIEDMKEKLELSGLTVHKERIINKEVVAALKLDDARRRTLVKKLTPRLLKPIALNFAGTVGSETFNRLVSGKFVYFTYVLKKNA